MLARLLREDIAATYGLPSAMTGMDDDLERAYRISSFRSTDAG